VRDVEPRDLTLLLELNEAEVPHVNSVPVSLFEWYVREAAYFRAACEEDRPLGFLAGLQPELPHTSRYFRWYCEHYPDFLYIDRVVVAPDARQRGVGRVLYQDIERFGRGRTAMLACEVNLVPRNEPSLRFHQRMGFHQIGTLETEGGAKVVSFLAKSLTDEAVNEATQSGPRRREGSP